MYPPLKPNRLGPYPFKSFPRANPNPVMLQHQVITSNKRPLDATDAPAKEGRPIKQAKISTFFAPAADTDPSSPKQPCDEQSTNALIYEWRLDRTAPDHPLFGTRYIGQVVREGLTCQEMFEARKGEHISEAQRQHQELGLHCAIRVFGAGAFTVRMVETTRQPRVQAMAWANEREIALIAEHGGVMRDCEPSAPMHQTFNLTSGGQGNARKVWEALQAVSRKRLGKVWPKFKAFYEQHGHPNAPRSDPDLGSIVDHIRARKDFLWHADFREWLYEHGFKMHAKDATKNAERWAAVNGAPLVPGG